MEDLHIMYIAEVCCTGKSDEGCSDSFHARTVIGMNSDEREPTESFHNGVWSLENLQEDENYTVRVKTILNGKTVSIISKSIVEGEVGTLDKIQKASYKEERESMNSNREATESV